MRRRIDRLFLRAFVWAMQVRHEPTARVLVAVLKRLGRAAGMDVK